MYEIPPGAKLPEHQHNSQRYGYLLAGQLRVINTETGESKDYKPGDFIVESRGQWHRARPLWLYESRAIEGKNRLRGWSRDPDRPDRQ